MSTNLTERSQSVESLDSTGKQKSFQRLCVRFAEKTSMQGVPYINSAKLCFAKIVWVFLLLAAIGAMTFHLYYLCDQFFAWPKVSKITLNFSNLELPEVTICNNNVIRKSRLHLASPDLQSYVDSLNPTNLGINQRKKRYIQELKNFNFSRYQDYDYEDYYDNTDGLGPKSETSQVEDTFTQLYMEQSRDIRVRMGHSIHDMLLSCSFNGRDCYADNFTLYTTAEYGNCYTLPSVKFVAKQSGPSKGLRLILYMENEEYLEGIAQGYGARVSLRDKSQIPFPADDGFFVSSYTETDIGLKLVQIERESEPYGTCDDGSSFKAKYKRTYSRQACQVMWEENYLIEKCGCFNEKHAEIFTKANITKHHPCRGRTEKKCQAKHMAELQAGTSSPSCNNPCTENQYVRQVSSRQWPTEQYSNFLMQGVCEAAPIKCANLRTYDQRQLTLNFVKINLYYEDLNYERIKEEPEIENAQFASDVGGAIGLWIGLSMLSLFEVVQLCVELCAYGVHKCRRGGERKQKKKERTNKTRNHPESKIEFGYQNDNYDHLKRHNGYRENMYQPAITPTQRSHDYQSVDNYYIYKGPQRI